MSILTDAQKSSLVGRLLGVPEQGNAANAPERVAPTGTTVGTEPRLLAGMAQNRTVWIVGGVLAVVAILYLAKKL